MAKNWFPLIFSRLGNRNRSDCYLIESVWFLKKPDKAGPLGAERKQPAAEGPRVPTVDAVAAGEVAAHQAQGQAQG